mmetsp:Transcript_107145/g.309865  ORF Transcript_107145/g.309865 Transcript_107145/m.309865 type:complete len:360 (+) Transcript_107145:909-1988(+)
MHRARRAIPAADQDEVRALPSALGGLQPNPDADFRGSASAHGWVCAAAAGGSGEVAAADAGACRRRRQGGGLRMDVRSAAGRACASGGRRRAASRGGEGAGAAAGRRWADARRGRTHDEPRREAGDGAPSAGRSPVLYAVGLAALVREPGATPPGLGLVAAAFRPAAAGHARRHVAVCGRRFVPLRPGRVDEERAAHGGQGHGTGEHSQPRDRGAIPGDAAARSCRCLPRLSGEPHDACTGVLRALAGPCGAGAHGGLPAAAGLRHEVRRPDEVRLAVDPCLCGELSMPDAAELFTDDGHSDFITVLCGQPAKLHGPRAAVRFWRCLSRFHLVSRVGDGHRQADSLEPVKSLVGLPVLL